MQLILQTLVPNESSCSLDSENVPGFKIWPNIDKAMAFSWSKT